MKNKTIVEHFNLIEQIQATYREGDYDKCEKLCKMDMKIFPQYIVALEQENDFALDKEIPLRMVSFGTLAKLCEKQGRYGEVIGVCDTAIKFKLPDGTKSDFEVRKEKRKRKLS
jgi:hypothetical protein